MREIREVNELFLLTVLSGLVGSYLYTFLGMNHGDYFISLLYSQFILVLPTIIYIIIKRISIKELFRFHKIKIGTVFLIVLFAFLIMPLMQEINLISMLFAKNEITTKMYAITENKPFLVSLLVIAVVPAVLEESVYRGCFFHTYSKKSPLKAILLSGLLFGLMHLNFNQFSYAFIMGMIFCTLIEGTDSIVSSMIVHFVINGWSVIMLYLMPAIRKIVGESGADVSAITEDVSAMPRGTLLMSIVTYGFIACFTTVLAVLVYIAIAKHEGRWEYIKQVFQRKDRISSQEGAMQGGETIFSIPLILGCGICIVYMILNEIV